ncbi:DUF3373 domain-containing protein [Desulfurivibrio alkaliphilus]|uniref:DUF3373 domain-containing protein n=1 Tax=Desulfurivibrio alkaliphilus (strain DSM 19089 / UNIQEM U267 / AHT2) TaxID=589865 RepID=D6Z5N7_DESAT|nr:DUF3373 domain-containing protein [Desulfurivibrio alkaliphilus]ADH86774.1 conserved hypothetical protein [Desulfurivibrio alkaliphilus AHT 2]
MRKKISMLALAGALVIPGAALAQELSLEERVEALTREVEELKAHTAELDDTLWHDMSTRFHLSGDFRSRYDYYSRDRYVGTNYVVPPGFTDPVPTDTKKITEKNKNLMTNRLRLNMYAKAQDNVEFVGRLAMFKAWGMQNAPNDDGGFFGGYPGIDGNSGRRVDDNKLLVDRAIVNWNNIADTNFWFSIGRRPTTDGPPSQLRMNSETRMATPLSYMDWPFDGLTIGYAYDKLFNLIDLPGRVRFCYGRGFEAGLGENTLKDTDFMGISWDIYNQGSRFVYFQSYVAKEVFNYPDISDAMVAAEVANMMGPRDNIGDIYHTSAMYMDQWQNLNYFIGGGWSRTDPNRNGMFNDYMAMMMGTDGPNTDSENGYSIYLGVRYDLPQTAFKFGAEYNYGSEYWIGMSPGHDDIYASKLATRGQVFEIYGIYDIPGRPVSRFGNAFIRVGYQHYDYDYTGSLDWNMRPYDLGKSSDRTEAAAMGVAAVDKADQVYVTFEARF